MILTVIFGLLAVFVVVTGRLHPRAAQQPMIRLGSIFLGAALAIIAVSILLA